MTDASVIIVAAGSGKRMGGRVNKPYIELSGRPVLHYSVSTFLKCRFIKEMILVIREKDRSACKNFLKGDSHLYSKKIKIVTGGKERQDSVFNGLKAVSKKTKIVLIHDAARPFISVKLVNALFKTAVKYKAALPVVPVKETVKLSFDKQFVDATLDRKKLFLAQTPQAFDHKLIMGAYRKAYKDNFFGTDDCMLVERIKFPVKLVKGDETNRKITTPEDL